MKFKSLAAALVAALLTGVATADPPKAFEVTPGFKIEKGFTVTPPMAVPTAPAPAEKAPVADADDPVWFSCRITVDHGNGNGSAGSGTPVWSGDGKTLVLTNAHVVPRSDSTKPLKVIVAGRTFVARYVEGSEVLTLGPGSIHVKGPDLALLEIDAEIGHVELAADVPPVGAQVWQFGYGGRQLNQGAVIKSGTVRANQFVEPTLFTDLSSISGDSGSGVFNTAGELCGVTWGGDPVKGDHCAVELGTVKGFLDRPLLAKLFPRFAAKASARREAREAARETAKLPPPMEAPPKVERKGPVDPKLASPAAGTPKAAPEVKKAPRGAGQPPPPPGEGWQWDEKRKVYWKWVETPRSGNAGNCPNGKCPNPRP